MKKELIVYTISVLLLLFIASCNVTDGDDGDDPGDTPPSDPEVSAEYQFDVTISGGGNVVEMSFGQIDGASNSFDPDLDLEAPPAPPEDIIHAWFVNDGKNLFKDYRDPETEEVIWQFNFEPAGNEQITIEWTGDIEELPGNIAITNSEGSVSVDLEEENSIELSINQLEGLQVEFVVN